MRTRGERKPGTAIVLLVAAHLLIPHLGSFPTAPPGGPIVAAADDGGGESDVPPDLGPIYPGCEAVARDGTELFRCLTAAAEGGNFLAWTNLGAACERGVGVSRNMTEAMIWYRKAADQGSANAQYGIGVLYANGLGVPRDYGEAVRWYRKAAELGDGKGRENLEKAETLLESQRK